MILSTQTKLTTVVHIQWQIQPDLVVIVAKQNLATMSLKIHIRIIKFRTEWEPVDYIFIIVYIVYINICQLIELTRKITGFLPHRSLNCPQNVELNIIPKNTIVVVSACW